MIMQYLYTEKSLSNLE